MHSNIQRVQTNMCFPGGLAVKNLPANAEDLSLVPGSGRSPREENGNPLQYWGLPRWLRGKESPTVQELQETQFRSLGQEDPLEAEMATHSSILAWEIPWTEEPGKQQSMGSQRVKHD